MNNAKHTRRALLSSVVALVICLTMLMGTTFAWFTDTATVSVNTIQSGTLDVQLLDAATKANIEGQTLDFKKAEGHENEEILWEPGCTYELPAVIVRNNGNLALKYEIVITGIKGDAKLNEAIEWTITNATGEFNLLPKTESPAITIKGHMKEDAGNDYQDLTIDGIAITVLATQYTHEYDSTDNQYDKDATYASAWDGTIDAEGLVANTDNVEKTVEIKTAAQLAAFAADVNAGNKYAGYTVSLMAPIDLAGIDWAPIGATNGETIDSYPSYTFSGTFNGNGLTISGLNVTSAGANAVAGLFGSANRATIMNVVVDGATIKSEHYAAGILAYDTEYTNVIGCTVKNSTIISSTNGNGDNGDKVGGIVGAMTGANADYAVKGNTVENCVIVGYRDCGGIIGMAADGLVVEDNTVINTSIAQDLSDDYKSPDTPTTFGAIVGRGNPALANNTEENVTVGGTVANASDSAEFNAALADANTTIINVGAGTYAMNGANSTSPVTGKTIVGNGETVLDSINGFADCTFVDITVNDIYTLNGNVFNGCEIVAPVNDVACATRLLGDAEFVGCTFTANGAGTSLWLDDISADTSATFTDCVFVDNIRLGGNESNSYVFENCTFEGGTVNWSKALVITYAPTTFENCTFNVAEPALYGVRVAVGMTADDVTLINTNTNIMVP